MIGADVVSQTGRLGADTVSSQTGRLGADTVSSRTGRLNADGARRPLARYVRKSQPYGHER
jgi:hypothetical protein